VAGVLTPELSGAAVRDTAGALIGMRRSLTRNAPGGSSTVQLFRTIGLGWRSARSCAAWSGSTTRVAGWTCWPRSTWAG
jgi:hypothetical protein